MKEENYYNLLEVDKNADADTIKKAYRKKAMQFHPDRNQGNKEAEEMFKKVSQAYSVLSDPQEKEYYDRMGTTKKSQASNPFDVYGAVFQDIGDLFENHGFFSHTSSRGRSHRRIDPDNKVSYRINLEQAIIGKEVDIEFKRYIECEKCNGQGYKSSKKKCHTCNGQGKVASINGIFQMVTTCPKCHGLGIETETCKKCNGRGFEEVIEKGSVKIPAGINRLSSLRLKGKGNEVYRNGQKYIGDIYIVIDYSPKHKNIICDNGDLYLIIEVPFNLAIGEENIKINILDLKEIELKLDSAKPSGYQYKVAKAGLTENNNAFIKVFISLPKNKINEEQKNKLLKLVDEIYGRCNTKFNPHPIDS